jgi:hypothetical protein
VLCESDCVEFEDTTLAYQEFQGDSQGPLQAPGIGPTLIHEFQRPNFEDTHTLIHL